MGKKSKTVQDIMTAYKAVFNTKEGKEVLEDLARFCGWGISPYDKESYRETDRRIAYQEVFMHIMSMVGEDIFENIQTEVINHE